jgi:hypothetical protein
MLADAPNACVFLIVFKENRSDQIDPERNNVKWWVHAIAGSRQCEQSTQGFQTSSDGGKYLNNRHLTSARQRNDDNNGAAGESGGDGGGVFDGVDRRYL